MYSKTIIVGNLGRDPESRFTPNGKQVTSFSVAVNNGYGDKKITAWYRVSAWNKLAEICLEYLKKGSLVLIDGRLEVDAETGRPRIWIDDNGNPQSALDITADTMKMLSSKKESQSVDDAFPVA